MRRSILVMLAMLLLIGPGAVWAQRLPKDLPPVRILPPQPPEPLVRAGPEPDLEILFTSDVRGFYQPCG